MCQFGRVNGFNRTLMVISRIKLITLPVRLLSWTLAVLYCRLLILIGLSVSPDFVLIGQSVLVLHKIASTYYTCKLRKLLYN